MFKTKAHFRAPRLVSRFWARNRAAWIGPRIILHRYRWGFKKKVHQSKPICAMFNRNPYNGYINPYYWVDDHPLLYIWKEWEFRHWHILKSFNLLHPMKNPWRSPASNTTHRLSPTAFCCHCPLPVVFLFSVALSRPGSCESTSLPSVTSRVYTKEYQTNAIVNGTISRSKSFIKIPNQTIHQRSSKYNKMIQSFAPCRT